MAGFLLARARLVASALWRRLLERPPSPPDWPASLRLAGLDGTVLLQRDECGVPFVEAGSLHDLGAGLGVAMAQDRLFQMEAMRRLAAGRLAELLGDRPFGRAGLSGATSLLAVDRLYRGLRIYPVAREEWARLPADGRALLEGFAGGVNGWLECCRPHELPPECILLGRRPEPWRPEDSLAVGKLFGWMLSMAFSAKPTLARLASHPELAWLLPPEVPGAPAILDGPLPGAAADLDLAARRALGLTGSGAGSNAWVLDGRRTASGGPLLCNDPHLLLELPAVWYPAGLATPEFRTVGGTLPGVPAVLIGRNARLAWGFTAAMADDGDYYRETLDAAGSRVRRGEGWQPVEVVEETFRVRGRPPVVEPLRFVRHEGVRCPLYQDGEGATSYRWVGFEPWESLPAFLGMARARNVAEFERAVATLAVPAQHALVADREGSIAYFCAGRFPRRPATGSGRPLLDGAEPAHAWQGYLPWEAHPRALDPPAGFLATANNRPQAELPPALAGGFWEPAYRAARLQGVLAGCRHATVAEMELLQSDVLSLQAVGLLEALVRPSGEAWTDPAAARAARLLLSWDGRLEAESGGAALYHLFYRALLGRCIRPALEAAAPGLFRRYLATLHLAVPAVDRALARGDPRCFPQGVGPTVEACLAEAWAEAERRLGPDPAAWRWGRLHRLTLRHAIGRGRAPAARLAAWLLRANHGPFPRPGDGMTVNLGAFCLSDPFAILAGPSYRQAVDLGRPEESRWALAGGASGDPRSVHYADQVAAWLAGRSRPMRLGRPSEAGGSTIRLVSGRIAPPGAACYNPETAR